MYSTVTPDVVKNTAAIHIYLGGFTIISGCFEHYNIYYGSAYIYLPKTDRVFKFRMGGFTR